MLAKRFGDAPAEYKLVAAKLGDRGVLDDEEAAVFVRMAGYRNRLVHFYDRVSEAELYDICTARLAEVKRVLRALHRWIRKHPEDVERAL